MAFLKLLNQKKLYKTSNKRTFFSGLTMGREINKFNNFDRATAKQSRNFVLQKYLMNEH